MNSATGGRAGVQMGGLGRMYPRLFLERQGAPYDAGDILINGCRECVGQLSD